MRVSSGRWTDGIKRDDTGEEVNDRWNSPPDPENDRPWMRIRSYLPDPIPSLPSLFSFENSIPANDRRGFNESSVCSDRTVRTTARRMLTGVWLSRAWNSMISKFGSFPWRFDFDTCAHIYIYIYPCFKKLLNFLLIFLFTFSFFLLFFFFETF